MYLSADSRGHARGKNQNTRTHTPASPRTYLSVIGLAVFASACLTGLGILRSTVTLTIRNQDCPPLHVTRRGAVSIPGTTLPDTFPTGTSVSRQVLPVIATIDATNVDTVHVSMLGSVSDFDIAEGMTITADDMRIVGNHTTIDLNRKSSHDVLITCRKHANALR